MNITLNESGFLQFSAPHPFLIDWSEQDSALVSIEFERSRVNAE